MGAKMNWHEMSSTDVLTRPVHSTNGEYLPQCQSNVKANCNIIPHTKEVLFRLQCHFQFFMVQLPCASYNIICLGI